MLKKILTSYNFWKMVLLITVPGLWVLLDYPWDPGPGFFAPLENKTVDLRLRAQEPLKDPLKIFYITIDEESLQEIGDPPWDLNFFADLTQIAFKLGQAKAIGFEFVFSANDQSSTLLDAKKLQESLINFGAVSLAFNPQIIFGAEFTETPLNYLQDGNITRWGKLPLICEHNLVASQNPYPRVPTYPLIGPNWGRCGLLDIADHWIVDRVPRWIPLFSETTGGSDSLSILMPMRDMEKLPFSNLQKNEENFILLNKAGKELCRMPSNTQRTFWNLSLELLAAYHGLKSTAIQRNQNSILITNEANEILYHIPLLENQMLFTNWLMPWGVNENQYHLSLSEFYRIFHNWKSGSGRNFEMAQSVIEKMKGALILVGPDTPNLKPQIQNPLNEESVPSLSLYGNILHTIHSGKYLKILTPWQEVAVTMCLTIALGLLSFFWSRYRSWVFVGILMTITAYEVFAWSMMESYGWLLPMVIPMGASISTSILILVIRGLQKDHEREKITASFKNYLPAEVVNDLLHQSPKLGGEEAIVTAFLSDIQNFSLFSEKLDPKELVTLMNEYFDAMTHIIQKSGGTLDKYIGDAVMAIFGAPIPSKDHALKACIAACHIQHRQEELCMMWAKQGNRWPRPIHNMQTRIGLSTGPAIIGNMGSPARFNYTMMGETVNLASKAESLGRQYGSFIIATASTIKEAQEFGNDCVFRLLDKIDTSSKKRPIEIFEVVGLKDQIQNETFECLEFYQKGINAYYKKNLSNALKFFTKSATLEPKISILSAKDKLNPSLYWTHRILQEKELQRATVQNPQAD